MCAIPCRVVLFHDSEIDLGFLFRGDGTRKLEFNYSILRPVIIFAIHGLYDRVVIHLCPERRIDTILTELHSGTNRFVWIRLTVLNPGVFGKIPDRQILKLGIRKVFQRKAILHPVPFGTVTFAKQLNRWRRSPYLACQQQGKKSTIQFGFFHDIIP